jgi:FixJ family two-component response regulator
MRAIRDAYASLNPREREVMALVVARMLNNRLVSNLESPKSREVRRGKVMQKLKADSLADLVRMASSLGVSHASFDTRFAFGANVQFAGATGA